ncbi:hypothetical protein L198_07631 [Cryptococcus wingfieldii CBS 7118]|uniref:Uncharacterized protein n=1 Tax=Cryptococcus wingfieldii CBS 7118 TaxID=1295528 RepID=A0A1E3I5G7_9TREE|nr:hypothetical protein L198_07631 [Cryptococcus wingfieldii CBS 7118]ODN83934.1 hypothetical protein L198_07631 [Cryptococcus wingfieldii CBS 7118]
MLVKEIREVMLLGDEKFARLRMVRWTRSTRPF